VTTVNALLAALDREVGYRETRDTKHPDGNVTKYWQALDPGLQGQPWCAAFQSWVWRTAGRPLPPIDRPYGFVYCPDAVTWARRNGVWSTSGRYTRGDLVFFDWTGHGLAQHVGCVIADDGSTLLTIEGNTSAGDVGSQWNGGQVCRRMRKHGPTVLGALRSSGWLAAMPPIGAPSSPPPAPPSRSNPFPPPPESTLLRLAKPMMSGNAVRWVQWAAGCPVDGIFGPATEHAVKQFQAHSRCGPVDGIVGPLTRRALMLVRH
jgi:CHAP domain/Putative peptidoglycan binding domain